MNKSDGRAFSAITGMVSSMCAARHVNLEEIAERTRVFSGYNGKKRFSPAQLLALLLMWCTNGHTLRELAATVDIEIGFPLTDTGLLGRFRKCAAFLQEICKSLLAPAAPCLKGRRLRILDASDIRGARRRSLTRLHQALVCTADGEGGLSVRLDDFEVTRTRGAGVGERLDRTCYRYQIGEIAVADRGYYCARGIIHVHDRGADVIVRFQSRSSPIWLSEGGSLRKANLMEMIRALGLGPGEAGEIRGGTCVRSGARTLPVRVCVRRKTAEEEEYARAKLDKYVCNHHRAASGAARSVDEETYEFCRYIVLVTTLPAGECTAEEVLGLYRLRWQVELLFKRMKSIGELRRMPVWNDDSSEVYLLAKKLLFILMEAEASLPAALPCDDNAPWGEDLPGDDFEAGDDFLWETFRRRYHEISSSLWHRIPDAHVPEYVRLRNRQLKRECNRKRKRSLQMFRMSCQRAG